MKLTILPKQLLLIISLAFFVSSCGGDSGGGGDPTPNTLKWGETQGDITYAGYFFDDNYGGSTNPYPNEYFAIETGNYMLSLVIPQQYIDNQTHHWKDLRSFTIRFKHKNPYYYFNLEMDKASVSPAPRVAGGTFKVLYKSNDKYKIEAQINIHHYENTSPAIDVLKVYFEGTMAYDPSLSEFVDPDTELSI